MASGNTNFGNSAGTGTVGADGFLGPVTGAITGNVTGNLTGNQSGGSVAATTLSASSYVSVPSQIVAAAGTSSQTNATAITKSGFVITTVTNSTRGIRLPTAATGRMVWGNNAGAFAALVYPGTNDRINALSTNAALLLTAAKGALYRARDAVTWDVMTGA